VYGFSEFASAWEAIFLYDSVLFGLTLHKARTTANDTIRLTDAFGDRVSLMQVVIADGRYPSQSRNRMLMSLCRFSLFRVSIGVGLVSSFSTSLPQCGGSFQHDQYFNILCTFLYLFRRRLCSLTRLWQLTEVCEILLRSKPTAYMTHHCQPAFRGALTTFASWYGFLFLV